MALKRKRSTPTFSSPASVDSSSTTNGLPFFYAQSKPTPSEALYQKPTWSFPTYSSAPSSPETHHSSDLSTRLDSRTKKRHRDNRPDEQSIYGASCWIGAVIQMSTLADVCRCAASTISRLYEAQRLHPRAEPLPPSQPQATTIEPAQKSTLHSFWNISSSPQPPATVPMAVDPSPNFVSNLDTRCEDCDGSLKQEDAMDLDDGTVEQETACHSCRRHVCDRCAVLGNARVCLACATSR